MEGCPLSQAKQVPHRRYVHDYVERIHRAGLPGNVNPDLCLTLQDTVSATVQPVIAGLTPYGPLADVPGPKRRRGNGALPWQSRTRSERCWGPLLDHQVLR